MTRQDTEKQTILVVDDTPENIDVVSNALRGVFRVVAALSGDRALQIAERKPGPDLILLDVMMPVMDGYEVLRRLKENPLTRTIPVIFVTALTDVADEQKGFELGAVDYIVKPISPAIVRARVNAHLMIRRQHQDLAESLEILQRTQSELVQAEKLSGLGALVAGVAHEINTPISIVLSAATHFSALTERLKNQISRQELRQSDLQSFMTQTSEAARLMAVNAARAA
ncbi:MAG TPA: response regulator, partial [Rhodospirillaceae bacterium]|nr:response regulator [Rhodospirillaceae bacterium]